MKIFIPSKGRSSTIKTHLLLQGADYKVVLHNDEEKAEYIKNNPSIEPFIVVSGQPYGISRQRQWIKDNLVSDGEWFCFMDDNIKSFNKFPEPYYSAGFEYSKEVRRTLEDNMINIQELLEAFSETIREAEGAGTAFCGFSNVHNAFFSEKKLKRVGLIVAKMCLMKKDELRYDENIKTIDDYEYSIQAMIKYGKILVNSYIFPVAGHNERGGLGTLSERAPSKREDCEYMMKKYPDLLRYKDRKNSLFGCEVCLRSWSEKSFLEWRENYVRKIA